MSKIAIISFLVFFLISIFLNAQIQIGQDIDGEAMWDDSGKSVSMPDNNTLAIGAPGNNASGSFSGHVRIFTFNGSVWVQKGSDIDGEASNDESGFSVSMPDSNTVAIGAYGNDGSGWDAGHVRIFAWNGNAWVQKGIDIDAESAWDNCGWSVDMPDANTVAIGAPNNSGVASSSGHVRVFEWNGTAWVQKGQDLDGESTLDNFGWSTNMPNANTIAIGAPYNDGSGSQAGHVRVYEWRINRWIQKGFDIDGESAGDNSGISVSMPSPNTVAIGAYSNDGNGSNSGHVRIYYWNGTAWIQKGHDIDGEAASDYSGISVSMPDPNSIAIGATGNNGNGFRSGHVRVYSWDGSSWIQRGSDIDGEDRTDVSGGSVSMPDANTIAIGAIGNDDNGTYSGHTRVYSLGSIVSNSFIEADIEGNINVYQANQRIWVDLRKTNKSWSNLQLLNMKAQEVYVRLISDGNQLFSLVTENLSKGIYLIRLTDEEGGSVTQKIVIP